MPLSDCLYKVAFCLLEDEPNALDALQDLYLKLWEKRGALDDVRNPKGYCITLLRNLCLDRLRASERHRTEVLDEDLGLASGCSSDGNAETREFMIRFVKALDKLPATERKILKMKTLDNMSYDEIAADTGMTPLSLRVICSNARKKLKKVLL